MVGNSGEIIASIVASSGKSAEEVQKLISEKKKKFSGLLTDDGAAFMVAKELKVSLDVGKEMSEFMKISELEDGMQNVDLLVGVMQVFSPREFEKAGKKGLVCNLIVADGSGEIRLSLWRDDVKRLQDENIERGSVLLLRNCYVTSYKDRKQLNLGFGGKVLANPKNVDASGLPKAESGVARLGELNEQMNDVNVAGRVVRIFGITQFAKEAGTGRLLNFELADGSAKVRCTAWNDMVFQVNRLHAGDVVKIEGAYTKKGLQGNVELHLGWRARLLLNPKIDFEIPPLNELSGIETTEKKISGLQEGDRFVQIAAAIVDVNQGKLHFQVCPNCGSKLQILEEGQVCEKCGEVKQPAIELVLGLQVSDDSGQINAIFFAREAEKLLGMGKDEIRKLANEGKTGEIIEGLKKKLVGKKLLASGFVRKSKLGQELEFVGKQVELGVE